MAATNSFYSPRTSSTVRLAYQLPPVVESIRKGWLVTCKSSTIVSSILAVVSAQLLHFVKIHSNHSDFSSSTTVDTLLVFSYSSVFFNINAAIASLILADKLGSLAAQASRDPLLAFSADTIRANDSYLLSRYHFRRTWVWISWHWSISLLAGMLSMFMEIILYLQLHEPKSVQITIACVVVSVFIPSIVLAALPYLADIHESHWWRRRGNDLEI